MAGERFYRGGERWRRSLERERRWKKETATSRAHVTSHDHDATAAMEWKYPFARVTWRIQTHARVATDDWRHQVWQTFFFFAVQRAPA